MIKELIFSGKKWFQGDMPNYIGKTVIAPKSDIGCWSQNLDNQFLSTQVAEFYSKPSGVVNGYVKEKGTGNIYLHIFSWFSLNELLQNGGVSSSPLTHLYQGLRHLLDRKVALVND